MLTACGVWIAKPIATDLNGIRFAPHPATKSYDICSDHYPIPDLFNIAPEVETTELGLLCSDPFHGTADVLYDQWNVACRFPCIVLAIAPDAVSPAFTSPTGTMTGRFYSFPLNPKARIEQAIVRSFCFPLFPQRLGGFRVIRVF